MGVGSPRHVRVERRCEVGQALRTDEVGPLLLDVAQRTGDLGGQSIAIPRQRQDPCPSIVLKAALGDEATQLQLVDDRADGLRRHPHRFRQGGDRGDAGSDQLDSEGMGNGQATVPGAVEASERVTQEPFGGIHQKGGDRQTHVVERT